MSAGIVLKIMKKVGLTHPLLQFLLPAVSGSWFAASGGCGRRSRGGSLDIFSSSPDSWRPNFCNNPNRCRGSQDRRVVLPVASGGGVRVGIPAQSSRFVSELGGGGGIPGRMTHSV